MSKTPLHAQNSVRRRVGARRTTIALSVVGTLCVIASPTAAGASTPAAAPVPDIFGVTIPLNAPPQRTVIGGSDIALVSGPTAGQASAQMLPPTSYGYLGDAMQSTSAAEYAIWLKPNLAGIPPNAVISSASLSVAAERYDTGGTALVDALMPQAVDIMTSRAAWDANTDPVDLAAHRGPVVSQLVLRQTPSIPQSTGFQPASADLTSTVQAWVSGAQNQFGVMLGLFNNAGNQVHTSIRLAATPELTVEFHEGISAPPGTPLAVITAAEQEARSPANLPANVATLVANGTTDATATLGDVGGVVGGVPLTPVDAAVGTGTQAVSPPDNSAPDSSGVDPNPANQAPDGAHSTDAPPSTRPDADHPANAPIEQVLPGTTVANPLDAAMLTTEKLLAPSMQLAATPNSGAGAGGTVPTANGPAPDCSREKGADASNGRAVKRSYYCYRTGEVERRMIRYSVACQPEGCVPSTEYIGSAYYHTTLLGIAYNKVRSVDFQGDVYVDSVAGQAGGQRVSFGMVCGRQQGSPAPCQLTDGTGAVTGTWDAFNRAVNKHAAYTYTLSSPDYGTQNDPDNLDYYNFQSYVDYQDPYYGRGVHSSGVNTFRCDTATYLKNVSGTGMGCVFDKLVSLYIISRSDSKAGAEATHIYNAMYQPEMTTPKKQNKMVPGSVASGRPLTRTVDQAVISMNNKIARANCVFWYGSNYSDGRRQQCDEYPFASVNPGDTRKNNDYAADPIPSGANASGGGLLVAFYNAQRIIANRDQFNVLVT